MDKFEILVKGDEVVAVELGTFQSPKDIEVYVKQGFVEQELEIRAENAEQAILKFKDGKTEVVTESVAASEDSPSQATISDYSVGKSVYKFIEGFGWFLVAIGGLLAVMLMVELSGSYRATFIGTVVGMFPGLGVAFGGLLSVAMAQVMRATIATAENSQRILDQISQRD